MFSPEINSSSNEDFTLALHLLHSEDPNSASELRALLDNAIARRYDDKRQKYIGTSFDYENGYKSRLRNHRGFKDAKGNDVNGKDEVPRISIPDEDLTDAPACKVCNVAALGPLVLIQCCRCKDFYHLLCHQPPIVENDINLEWRCSECEKNVQDNRSAKKDVSIDGCSKSKLSSKKKFALQKRR